MKVTGVLLLAAVGCLVWAYVAPGVWSIAAAVVTVWLAVRWIRRQPKPRLDKAREFAKPQAASARAVVRRGERSRRQHGLASAREVRRHGSTRTVRRLATTVRPSLAELGPITRRRTVRTRDVAVRLCRVGLQTVWSSIEDVVLYVAAPRQGKSGWLGSATVDYPGPVVATTTRVDFYKNTQQQRRERGPVWVFNAGGFSNMTGAVTFDPLTDCTSPDAATERAADMVPVATGEQEHWASLARAALAALMHAAALGGHTIDIVQRWVAAPAEHKATVIRLLRSSPSTTVVEEARQFLECNERTRSSITTSIMPALRWLQSPVARAAAGLDGVRSPFHVADLLAEISTLYVLGRSEDHTEPLMSALTGYVARNARRAADGGRLDPPLGLMLDEAAQLKPPLPEWTADMGGSGITIVAVFQSRAQLISAWGSAGAGIILNNAGSIMLGGGTKDPDDLSAWSALVGKRDERTVTTDERGQVKSTSQRQVDVLSAAALAHMPPKRVVVFHHGMPPALGWVQMVWERRDLRLLPHLHRARGWITSTSATSPRVEQPGVVVERLTSPRTSTSTTSAAEEVGHRV